MSDTDIMNDTRERLDAEARTRLHTTDAYETDDGGLRVIFPPDAVIKVPISLVRLYEQRHTDMNKEAPQ